MVSVDLLRLKIFLNSLEGALVRKRIRGMLDRHVISGVVVTDFALLALRAMQALVLFALLCLSRLALVLSSLSHLTIFFLLLSAALVLLSVDLVLGSLLDLFDLSAAVFESLALDVSNLALMLET